MTANDDLIGQIEVFLDESEGSTVMPDSVRVAVRAAVDNTPQSRPMPGLARFPHMNAFTRIGLAATAVIVAALIGINYFGRGQNVGPPTQETSPAPSVAEPEAGGIPPELRTVFLGPAKDIPELGEADRGDFDLSDGFMIYHATEEPAFYAAVHVSDDTIQLTTTTAGLCAEGDVGIYQWSLSRGDSILTVGEGTDDCSARSTLMPGDYLRSACRTTTNPCLGSVEAGTWDSHYFEPRPSGDYHPRHGAMRFTLPEGWAAYSDDADGYGLTPQSEYAGYEISTACYDCPGIRDAISVIGNPGAATEDCGEEGNVPGIGFGAQDLVDWLRQHPGLITTDPEAQTINGLPALALYIEAATTWTGTCGEDAFVAVPVFYRVGSYHWALSVGTRYHVTLLDLGDGNTVAVMVDTADDADLESFVDAAMPIIESLEFPER